MFRRFRTFPHQLLHPLSLFSHICVKDKLTKLNVRQALKLTFPLTLTCTSAYFTTKKVLVYFNGIEMHLGKMTRP